MKKALMILSSILVAVGAFAQGQVNFAAKITVDPDPTKNYNAPVFVGTVAGGTLAAGTAYMVQLYSGVVNSQSALTAVGSPLPFRTGAAAGLWSATAVNITAVDPTTKAAFVQVRAWATAAGATYEAALAANGGTGFGNIVSVVPTVAPAVPQNLAGLQSFAISGIVPEPSIMALGALGGLALLLRRRK
jgi:hypothetical protein